MTKRKRRSRQLFVLTLEEKKTVACVLGALLLGLATSHYRATHPRPPAPLTERQQWLAKTSARTEAARAQTVRRRQAMSLPSPTPQPEADDDDDGE